MLYGGETGDRTAAELELLLDRFRRRLGSSTGSRPRFDQADALLITYGDSFLAPPAPPLAGLREFASRHLAGRVLGLHILPFFPYSSDYGFSVIDYLSVAPALGSWDDISALRSQFRLMFDFVLNHVSARSRWFQAFLRNEPPENEFFITVDPSTDLSGVTRPRTTPLLTRFETARGPEWVWTTFSADQVDLNYHNPRVLVRMVEVMLSYVERGADLLRLDAAGYLWKELGTSCIHLPQTHQVIRVLRDVLDEVAPDVAIVTETNVPHLENITYFGSGHDEAQMVYQFPLPPLMLDALARGDGSHLAAWARELSAAPAGTTFLNFLASHDGIGVVPARGILTKQEVDNLASRIRAHGGQVSYRTNPEGGESVYELNCTLFDALNDPGDASEPWQTRLDRYICAQAIMLALAGVPGIYVHGLLGSHNDHEGFARSGWKRDLNHHRLDLPDLERQLADASTEVAQVFARYAQLLEVRAAQPALHPSAPQRVLPSQPAVFALRRGPWQGQSLVAVHNLTGMTQVIDPGSLGLAASESYADVISGRWLTPGAGLRLDAYGTVWLQAP